MFNEKLNSNIALQATFFYPFQTTKKNKHTQPMRTLLIVMLCMAGLTLFAQPQCDNDSTGLIPLVDLGTGYYAGHQGGLFPGGTNNIPLYHRKRGVKFSNESIKPLDSLGNIDYDNGRIIFLGMGASLASNAFNAYIDSIKIYDFEGMNNCLDVKGMFFGGKDLDQMIDFEDNSYWESVRGKMEDRGDSYEQVQAIWLLQQSFEDTSADFNTYYSSVFNKYVTLMQVLKDTFPNLKQVYLSGVHYMGYMDPNHFRYDAFVEPHGYWGNIVIKEIIEHQIMGDPALKYKGVSPNAAWISWGPNFWADGKNPRIYDGLSWTCDQYRDDETGGGFHLQDSTDALGIEAQMLKDFFTTDAVAKIWHQDGPLWSACPIDTLRKGRIIIAEPNTFLLFPNPATNTVVIKLSEVINSDFEINIFDALGKIVEHQTFSNYTAQTIPLQLHCDDGIYFVEINTGASKMINELVVQH